jgi:hypothetical protein
MLEIYMTLQGASNIVGFFAQNVDYIRTYSTRQQLGGETNASLK